MRYGRTWMWLCAALTGCGGPPELVCPDGSEPIDGDCAVEDAGSEMDAGDRPEPDGGRADDAGMIDGGRVEMDAGRVEVDAGRMEMDAGRVEMLDAGCTARRFYADGDGDGFGNAAVSIELCEAPSGFVEDGTDCDDACAACHPGGTEVCDGEDNDCAGGADDGVLSTFYRDTDGDGHGAPGSGTRACSAPVGFAASNDDCDDTCSACFPGGTEVCDGEDNDCAGGADDGVLSTFYRDTDGDGHGAPGSSTRACSAPVGFAASNDDCDDTCSACFPGGTEVCDGEDNDCAGGADDGVLSTFYRDVDLDGHGTASTSMQGCIMPPGYASSSDDCNDACASCFPGGTEVCDGSDNDCDSSADEGVTQTFYRDMDLDGHGAGPGMQACARPPGYAPSNDDCDDGCSACYPGNPEVCDGNDNDCDSSADEGVTRTFYRDDDRDGHGAPSVTIQACSAPAGYAGVGDDCNDSCASCYPGNPEVCDGNDNDCDSSADEGVTRTFYRDVDRDGHGAPGATIQACTAPAGYAGVGDDCNDSCASCYPGNPEVCDGNDNDCDSSADEGVTRTFYRDVDADGHGTASVTIQACTTPAGYADVSDDCNDACASCYPANPEVCDGNDNDCDGTADEGVTRTFYRDMDTDGYGTSTSVVACAAPTGYAAMTGDCNDACATCYPGRAETCDGLDNNCNTTVDEGVTSTFYRDADLDGYGTSADTRIACSAPSGYIAMNGDCNDACATCYPGRAEVCDTNDNDCDGTADEGVTTTYYRDADADGYGISSDTRNACSAPSGYAAMMGDCNDMAMSISPGATEVCNAIDDNCSGAPDEGFMCVRGSSVSCTTSCGSTGMATCTSSCTIPTGSSCPPPAEVCNGRDDDCDGIADEQLFRMGPQRYDSYPADFARPEAVVGSGSLYTFWQAAGSVSAWRHAYDGAPTATAQVPLGGTANYDVDTSSTGVLAWAYVDASGNVVVQRLSPTTFAVMWSTTITVSATQVQLAIGSTAVYVFTVEAAGRIYRRQLGVSAGGLGATVEIVGTTSGVIALADDGVDRQLLAFRDTAASDVQIVLMQGTTAPSIVSTRAHTSPNIVDQVAIASPWGASADPDVVVVYTTIGGSAAAYNTRYVSYRAGYVTRSDLVVAGQTSATGAGALRSRIDLEYADGTYLFAGALTSTYPTPAAGVPTVAQINPRSSSAFLDVLVINTGLLAATHESLAVVRYPDAIAQPDRLFYNPSLANGIASMPIGCY